jgi:hypothetical protein
MQESSSETSANHSAIVILKAASWQLPPIAACGKPLALRALYRELAHATRITVTVANVKRAAKRGSP